MGFHDIYIFLNMRRSFFSSPPKKYIEKFLELNILMCSIRIGRVIPVYGMP